MIKVIIREALIGVVLVECLLYLNQKFLIFARHEKILIISYVYSCPKRVIPGTAVGHCLGDGWKCSVWPNPDFLSQHRHCNGVPSPQVIPVCQAW